MNQIDKLTEYFKEFPGIGPRQARRFVYFLLRKNDAFIRDFVSVIPELKRSIKVCKDCCRYFTPNGHADRCAICSDDKRDAETLMIVSRDTDMESVERNGVYEGYYFILGGIVPVLEEQNASRFIQIDNLQKRIDAMSRDGNDIDDFDTPQNSGRLKEIILAMNANPDGDNTADYLRKVLDPVSKERDIKITVLGRGLSTGTELEYSDKDTILNALKNRQ